jgi:hypothetical protein
MFGKDFTDPMTLLTALGITNCPVVEEDSKWRIYWRDFSITIYGFPMSKPYQLQ